MKNKVPEPDANGMLYGVKFKLTSTAISREVYCIQQGGHWFVNRKRLGAGLFTHYRNLQTLIWPDHDHHRWSDLVLKSILENRITAILGARDSGKTHTMAMFALTDYFCFPHETLILMSSTDMQGLQLRVWGEIKDLYNRARETWPDCPGNVLESLHGIFTDELTASGEPRDLRKGLICVAMKDSSGQWVGLRKYTGIKQKRRRLLADECFPAGTLVDTPSGPRAIETLKRGDVVWTAFGAQPVIEKRSRLARQLATLHFTDGRQITCTPEHPFLTLSGWKKACEVGEKQFVVSPHETLQALSTSVPNAKTHLLLQTLLHDLVLLHAPRADSTPDTCENAQGQESCEMADVERQPHEGPRATCAAQPNVEGYGAQTQRARWERHRADEGRGVLVGAFPDSDLQLSGEDGQAERQRFPGLLQGGFGLARDSIGGGSRRQHAQHACATCAGPEKGKLAEGSWVARVEIHEPGDFGEHGTGGESCEVFNLQVAGHPSYSVNGFVVHNCQFYADSYVSALANLNKNDFKCVVAGNPIGEGDPLDKLAEPVDGWDSQPEIVETTTWKNRQGGITINLVGLDSPAITEPNRYPYLINQKDIDYIANYWGKESAEYFNQAAGIRRPGISLKRVVTRDMVVQFKAQDEAVWKGTSLTRIYAIDAGYGGDRCVAGEGVFGMDINNKLILALSAPRIIPIRVYPKDVPEDQRLMPEDQIAEYVKADCERLGIPSANVFHDATGRGSLGTAFARLWRDDTNPVEFGGSPTPRPVLADLYIYDEKIRQKRLKRCDEHYSKRVSELHFSVRYLIEAGQLRGLTNDVMEELCRREWTRVRGNKIEVESKEDTKERLGRSPDLADWCAIVVEGARCRGLVIAKLDTGKNAGSQDDGGVWRDILRDRVKKLRDAHTLNYAA